MAMEINGNLPDYAVRMQNYGSHAAENTAAGSTKRKETEKYEISELFGSITFFSKIDIIKVKVAEIFAYGII